MNQQKMIEHIATEVMGYEKREAHPGYFDEMGRLAHGMEVWFNPFENHREAFEALDKLATQGFVIDLCIGEIGGSLCEITRFSAAGFSHCVAERHENLLHAICIAICRATGYEAEE